jgi:hypothetical protein
MPRLRGAACEEHWRFGDTYICLLVRHRHERGLAKPPSGMHTTEKHPSARDVTDPSRTCAWWLVRLPESSPFAFSLRHLTHARTRTELLSLSQPVNNPWSQPCARDHRWHTGALFSPFNRQDSTELRSTSRTNDRASSPRQTTDTSHTCAHRSTTTRRQPPNRTAHAPHAGNQTHDSHTMTRPTVQFSNNQDSSVTRTSPGQQGRFRTLHRRSTRWDQPTAKINKAIRRSLREASTEGTQLPIANARGAVQVRQARARGRTVPGHRRGTTDSAVARTALTRGSTRYAAAPHAAALR